MKKTWLFLPVAFMALALGACGGDDTSTPESKGEESFAPSETSIEPSEEISEEISEEEISEEEISEEEISEEEISEESSSEKPVMQYFVVGAFNNWTQRDPNYVMTQDPDDQYHFTFVELPLKQGQELKCVSTSGSWYPEGMGNNTVATETAYYTVHLHTNNPTETMTTLEKTGDYTPVGETQYFAVGAFNAWAAQDANYVLTKDPDDETHYVFEGLTLLSGESSKHKVVDSDGTWYPGGADRTVSEDGVYRIDFYTNTKDFTTTRTGDLPVEDHTYFVVGSFNEWTVNGNEAYALTPDSEDSNHFTLKGVTLAEKDELKVTDEEEGGWYGNADGGNVVVGASGTYDIHFYLKADEGTSHIVIQAASL